MSSFQSEVTYLARTDCMIWLATCLNGQPTGTPTTIMLAHLNEIPQARLTAKSAVCVNSFETTWLQKLGSTHNVDGEAALQSERSP